jgi:hydroxymethylbilane synthase
MCRWNWTNPRAAGDADPPRSGRWFRLQPVRLAGRAADRCAGRHLVAAPPGQLRALRPDLELLDLRGNVNTRLAKLDNGGYDAIVLAVAGLERLGLGGRIVARLQPPQWLPAPAQGAVAVECDGGNARLMALFATLDDAATRACVEAERAMNRALHGSCHVPVAAIAQQGDDLHLQGLVGSASDGRAVRAEAVGPASDPEALGQRVAKMLLDAGAGELLNV